MRVVFLEDVTGVAQGGDVKDVKNGFARNYLLPKNLAVPATHNALQRVERLTKESDTTRLKTLEDMKALAAELDGIRVTVEMRAGSGGRLYGSVTNIIIAEELSKLTGREIERRTIELDEPLRELGLFEVDIHLHPEVEAKIGVLVYAMGTDPAAFLQAIEARGETEEAVAEEPVAEEPVAEEPVAEEEQPEDLEEDQSRRSEPEPIPVEETLAEVDTSVTTETPETESEPKGDP